MVCCCCCCCCLCCCFWARRGFWAEKQEILSGVSGVPCGVPQGRERGWDLQLYIHLATFESRSLPFLIKFLQESHQKHSFRLLFRHIWDSCVETRPDGDLENLAYIFLRLWDITVHTRPDGDLENLAIEKCTARDLKITLLHSASHGVLDLIALTCLTSWMRGVPCSFYLGSTYALTFTSQCTSIDEQNSETLKLIHATCWTCCTYSACCRCCTCTQRKEKCTSSDSYPWIGEISEKVWCRRGECKLFRSGVV